VPAGRARCCPRIVVETTSGTGHWVQLDAPDRVNAAIDSFVGTLKGVATR
jgi:pimeloyl-ACP methyl ester carboxylesterase